VSIGFINRTPCCSSTSPHKYAYLAGVDVHTGPGFVPWHRELCNRLEELLREVDSDLSLHYWDFSTDPRDTSGGRVNLFTSNFMGSDQGDTGAPLQNFESTEGGAHTSAASSTGGSATTTTLAEPPASRPRSATYRGRVLRAERHPSSPGLVRAFWQPGWLAMSVRHGAEGRAEIRAWPQVNAALVGVLPCSA
jgi:hypothetical protein